ncbi:MAG: hypothetical protein B7Y80_21160 [Hyphomicrobium sp. 32-62-53]|nr:MAG: hypothetical protein B7Z29_21060 [Hyphomicrobium sp. 12-62-95]OYX97016.1 MAG: hypothetical protein B7Y80_21160 [Hyphomicrobium sp. 32-62-53]
MHAQPTSVLRRWAIGSTNQLSAFTRDDLVAIAKTKFGKTMHPASMGRLLRRLGLSRQKARPTHPMKDPAAAVASKNSPANPEQNTVCAQK